MGNRIVKTIILILLPVILSGSIYVYSQDTKEKLIYKKGSLYLVPISHLHLRNFGFSSDTMKFRLYYKDKWIEIFPYSAWYKDTNTIGRMPYQIYMIGDTLLMPVQSFVYVLKNVFKEKISFTDTILYVGERNPNIKDVLISSVYGKTRIDIITNEPLDYIQTMPKDTTIKIFFPHGYADVNKINFYSKSGAVHSAVASNENNGSTILFNINKSFNIDSVITMTNGVRIVLKKEKKKKKTHYSNYKIETVIIDPGHGGRDPGAIGPHGLKEKKITLDIAKRLKKILQKNGFKVVMTRDKDKFVSLQERVKIANRYKNAIFVSIHCNAVPKYKRNKIRGVETYFLSPAKTDWARAVEARENAALELTNNAPDIQGLDFLLWDIAQNEFLEASNMLAEEIQSYLPKKTKIPDRGVSQAGFYVLKRNFMPGVLVETAFISNPKEEKLLKSSAFRQKIAEGIAKGIMKFKEKYERKLKK